MKYDTKVIEDRVTCSDVLQKDDAERSSKAFNNATDPSGGAPSPCPGWTFHIDGCCGQTTFNTSSGILPSCDDCPLNRTGVL